MTAASPDAVFVPDSEDQGVARLQKLSGRVAALRSRARGAGGDWDRYLLIGGGTAFALGLLFIALGAYGASRTVLLFEQIPYLVSGGLLGLGLVVAGGFIYWSYWQTTLVREGRAERAELVAGLARLEAVLERSLAAAQPELADDLVEAETYDDGLRNEPYDDSALYARPAARSGRTSAAADTRSPAARSTGKVGATAAGRTASGRSSARVTSTRTGRKGADGGVEVLAAPKSNGSVTRRAAKPTAHRSSQLVATASGTMLHRPDCTVVARRDNLRDVDIDTPGMTGCQLCDPLADD